MQCSEGDCDGRADLCVRKFIAKNLKKNARTLVRECKKCYNIFMRDIVSDEEMNDEKWRDNT